MPTTPATRTSAPDRTIARGVLAENKGETIILAIPGTDYRLLLIPTRPLTESPGERISGAIHAQAMRIDPIRSGGLFIEPVFGRPRRVQGRVIAIDAGANTLTINAAAPITCKTDARQKASQFEVGQLVSLDVEPGATFTPAF